MIFTVENEQETQPFGISVAEAAAKIGIGRTTMLELLDAKEIDSYTVDVPGRKGPRRKRLVVLESLKNYIKSRIEENNE